MGALHSGDLTVFFLGLAALLGAAHVLGAAARRLGQPVSSGCWRFSAETKSVS